jgi:hypothetical protein
MDLGGDQDKNLTGGKKVNLNNRMVDVEDLDFALASILKPKETIHRVASLLGAAKENSKDKDLKEYCVEEAIAELNAVLETPAIISSDDLEIVVKDSEGNFVFMVCPLSKHTFELAN